MDIDKLLNLGDNQPKQKCIVEFVGRCGILDAKSAFAKILAPSRLRYNGAVWFLLQLLLS